MNNVPYTRFRGCGKNSPALTTTEVIDWLKAHSFIWYQAPMNISPEFVRVTTKVKTWKRSPERFTFTIEDGMGNRFPIDEGHLDRLRLENSEWHHGISASVHHVHNIGPYSNVISHESRGYLKLIGKEILKTGLMIRQSNGYYLDFPNLASAINFAKREHMELSAVHGSRKRLLVKATPFKARFAQ